MGGLGTKVHVPASIPTYFSGYLSVFMSELILWAFILPVVSTFCGYLVDMDQIAIPISNPIHN